jgi:hypothetical protein
VKNSKKSILVLQAIEPLIQWTRCGGYSIVPYSKNRQGMKLVTLLQLIQRLRIYIGLTVFPLLAICINDMIVDS